MCGIGPICLRQGAAVALVLLIAVRPAAAHGLGAECKLHGNRVLVEAYFDDDTAAKDARVIVRDEAQKIIVEGRTDAKGLWSFARPVAGLYSVTVDAGDGHRVTIRIKVPARRETPQLSAADVGGNSSTDGTPRTPAAKEVVVSEGPSRAEFTRFPWVKVVLGLTIIAALNLSWWGLRRLKLRLAPSGSSPYPPVPRPADEPRSPQAPV